MNGTDIVNAATPFDRVEKDAVAVCEFDETLFDPANRPDKMGFEMIAGESDRLGELIDLFVGHPNIAGLSGTAAAALPTSEAKPVLKPDVILLDRFIIFIQLAVHRRFIRLIRHGTFLSFVIFPHLFMTYFSRNGIFIFIITEKGYNNIIRQPKNGENMKPTVLFEDNHLLVVNKPIQIATMGLPAGEETLLTAAKDYIAAKYHKPGNVYLGVVSRLDVPVSGVVVFARTSKAAERLNEQFRKHSVEKIYLAVVDGLIPRSGTCRDWIREDERHRKCFVTRMISGVGDRQAGPEDKIGANRDRGAEANRQSGAAREAILHYRRLARVGSGSLVEVRLETGRKHQIRLQLSHLGYPIKGDRKYGSKTNLPAGIALHARRLTLRHPTTGEERRFQADIPRFWNDFGLTEKGVAAAENEGAKESPDERAETGPEEKPEGFREKFDI